MVDSSVEETMTAYLDALRHGGDYARFLTDDVQWLTTETGDRLTGRETVRDFIDALHTQMFDAHVEVKNLVVGDTGAVLEADLVGIHTGEFAGIPPTGISVRVPYAVVYDVSSQGITALRVYIPITGMVQQLRAAASQTAGSTA